LGSIKVSLDELAGCAMQFHTIAITFEDLKSSMDHVFGSVDSKIKRRRNIDGSIADIQKSMKALYTEIENISLFVSSSKDIYDKTETHLEKESNSFIDRMEDIAGLKKEWYQENWFKIAVGTVVTGIAIAVVVVVGPELMFIAVGTVVGGGIYGITEGIESIRNGGEFIDGFSDGFMKGTIETFFAETVGCAGVGVGAKLFAGGTINSFSYTVSTQLNGGTVSAPDLAFEFAKGVGAIAAGEVIFAGIAKYAEKGLAKSVINEVKTAENPEIVGKEAKEIIEGGLKPTKELVKESTCTSNELYNYLQKNVDSNAAKNFQKESAWPEGVQIPKNSSVLNADGTISWDLAKNGGYTLDSNGNAIKKTLTDAKCIKEYLPEGKIIDRYGNSSGRYVSPVNSNPYSYSQRSLPYVEDISNYHQYKVTITVILVK